MRPAFKTACCLLLAATFSLPALAKRDKRDAGDDDMLRAAEEFAEARMAPGIVLPGAYGAAFAALQALPATSASWTEVTNRPYNSDDLRYRDPFASNATGGSGYVAGRMTGLAAGGGYLYAGGADGGVFRSSDGGATWAPMTDGLPTLSVGDLKLAPDGSLWLATGEANTGATSYVGSGVYRVAHPQSDLFTTASRVGGAELESTTIGKLRFDAGGSVYAASSRGLWKHAAGKTSGTWSRVLYPVPGSTSPYDNICNDVALDPRSNGRVVIANCAWRGGAAYNGFYVSTDGGTTFAKVNPLGALNPQDVGRATFAYAADGSALYVLLESIVKYTNNNNTALSGVYASPSGNVAGPWNKIADSASIGSSGSALKNSPGYKPGIQVWYNQFLTVDPADAQHVIVGMEEVYETVNGGNQWNTIGPYWNFDFACWSFDPSRNTCPMAPHSDQHSVAIADGMLYVGNDGGVYRRPLHGNVNIDGHATDWQSVNANLRTLQYYSVGVGKVPGGVAVSGGLQDNGGSLLLPEDLLPGGAMGAPFGGDGGDVLVDPDDGCKILGEYVELAMQVTTTCGRSDGTFQAIFDVAPGDPFPRFIAPFLADKANKNHWVAGGQVVWTYKNGFAISSGRDWVAEYDLGAFHSATALASQNDVIYAGWCGGCNPDGFSRGLATNAGGTWHQLVLPANVPNRYISALAIDPQDASGRTVYMAFSGFSRAFVEGPGAGVGHLYKSTDAGVTWRDVSGNLPDVPANSLALRNGKIMLATDLGVVISADGGTTWSRVGANLPYTTAMYLHVGPDNKLYAATHGRGIWSTAAP
jgi:photosystem II stability/assembly factor-like uncharacterized protein